MTHYRDEYKDIYEKYRGSGFKFDYNNRHIGKSKDIFEDEIESIDPIKRNHDDTPLFVFCKKCGEYMDFREGPDNALDGWWVCPICGARVRESTIYHKLERENANYIDRYYPEDGDDEFRPEDL